MKNRKLPVADSTLLAIGLLMCTTPPLLRDYIHIPDFALGLIVGVGLALEIAAFVRIKKYKKRLA